MKLRLVYSTYFWYLTWKEDGIAYGIKFYNVAQALDYVAAQRAPAGQSTYYNPQG